ncbi:MAG TPA: arginase [Candidatus Eremiobacteraceae bacterium]|nr:arginase [Candidatus Eremiobacteraceae bacterium]
MAVSNASSPPRPLVDLIGVPLDYGAGRRGVRFGPEAVREAALQSRLERLGYAVNDAGDVDVAVVSDEPAREPGHARYAAPIRAACLNVAGAVERALAREAFPVVLGGDHSLAIGVLAGVARVKGTGGIIWIDAHADLNTPSSSPTGNIHGMSMAAALGDVPELFGPPEFPTPSVDSGRSVFVGLRDLDPAEKRALHSRGLTCFTMSDIDRMGLAKVMERAVDIAGRGPGSVHVSLDIDAIDPLTAPGTGTPVAGGLTYREAHLAMEIVAESGVAHSIEVVEVNPTLDDGRATAKVAADLICSALGKSIL